VLLSSTLKQRRPFPGNQRISKTINRIVHTTAPRSVVRPLGGPSDPAAPGTLLGPRRPDQLPGDVCSSEIFKEIERRLPHHEAEHFPQKIRERAEMESVKKEAVNVRSRDITQAMEKLETDLVALKKWEQVKAPTTLGKLRREDHTKTRMFEEALVKQTQEPRAASKKKPQVSRRRNEAPPKRFEVVVSVLIALFAVGGFAYIWFKPPSHTKSVDEMIWETYGLHL